MNFNKLIINNQNQNLSYQDFEINFFINLIFVIRLRWRNYYRILSFLLYIYVIYISICLLLNFLGRSHQCQLVMNGDFSALFVTWSCPFNDIQFIEANGDTFTYKLILSLCISCIYCVYMKETRKREKKVSKSDELLLLLEWICHYRIVTECIVAVRSCVK